MSVKNIISIMKCFIQSGNILRKMPLKFSIKSIRIFHFVLYTLFKLLGINNTAGQEISAVANFSEAGFDDLFVRAGYPNIGDIPLLNKKIFKGYRVSAQEHPYIVSVRRQYSHYVTAALLTKKIVITVAHPIFKVPTYELGVVAGETYSDRGTMLRSIVLMIIHEDFNPYTLAADLALLQVYEEFVYKINVKSIALIAPTSTLNDERVFVTGWGRCDLTGKELCLPRTTKFTPGEKMDPMMRTISFVITSPNYYCDGYERHETRLQSGMLCAGVAREENAVAPCLAVPGAALVAHARLVGLQSWGFGCGYHNDLPLVYTDLRHYQPWIVHNIPILRNLRQNNLTEIFEVMKAYMLSKWLSITRERGEPLMMKHTANTILQRNLDTELSKLKGNVLDIRDFIYSGEFHKLKKTMIENMRLENTKIPSNVTAWQLPPVKAEPFLDKNKYEYEDYITTQVDLESDAFDRVNSDDNLKDRLDISEDDESEEDETDNGK